MRALFRQLFLPMSLHENDEAHKETRKWQLILRLVNQMLFTVFDNLVRYVEDKQLFSRIISK